MIADVSRVSSAADADIFPRRHSCFARFSRLRALAAAAQPFDAERSDARFTFCVAFRAAAQPLYADGSAMTDATERSSWLGDYRKRDDRAKMLISVPSGS